MKKIRSLILTIGPPGNEIWWLKHIDIDSRKCEIDYSLEERNNEQLVTSNTKGVNYFLKKAEDLAEKHGISFSARPLQPTMRHCLTPWLEPYIHPNGEVYPCCFMPAPLGPIFKEWYLGTQIDVPVFQYRMGNIFKDSF